MNEIKDQKYILILGIAGGLAQITAKLILEKHPHYKILGIDSRSVDHVPPLKGLECQSFKYSRGNFENLFRAHHFDTVFHLGRISHSSNSRDQLAKRLEMSVMGTNKLLDLCHHTGVKKVIILSTFHVYGALPDNSIFLTEDAPLKASITYPELRDVVEMDQICTNWMWKYQNQISTVVLRPCNIIGTQIQNSMSQFLTSPLSLKPIDYNPHFQFIHEFDMANVLCRSINDLPTGTYNVAGTEFIALREALDLVGTKSISFPIFLAKGVNQILKQVHVEVPEYLLDYLKFSCLIDNKLLKTYLGEHFLRFNIRETLELLQLR